MDIQLQTGADTKTAEIARILELSARLEKSGLNEGYLKKISDEHRAHILEDLEVENQFRVDLQR